MAKLTLKRDKKNSLPRVKITFNEEDYVAFELKDGTVKPVHKYLAEQLVAGGKGKILDKVTVTKDNSKTAKVIDVD